MPLLEGLALLATDMLGEKALWMGAREERLWPRGQDRVPLKGPRQVGADIRGVFEWCPGGTRPYAYKQRDSLLICQVLPREFLHIFLCDRDRSWCMVISNYQERGVEGYEKAGTYCWAFRSWARRFSTRSCLEAMMQT